MALAETVRLIASLQLEDLFTKKLAQAEKQLGSFETKIDKTQSRSFRAGQQIGTGIIRTAALAAGGISFLAANVALGVRSLDKLESSVAQTNAVLKSTKGVAGQTADSVRALATKYEDLNATIDDTVIQSGENLLLTFTNIRTKAFEPALRAALDMNQALGGGEEGLQGTIQRLGKALNDPIKGLTQLGRVGVTFTKEQQAQIKAAVKAGDTFKAQGIILAELNKRFGGSFLAGGQTTAGKVAKFKDAVDDLQRALATALLPVIGKVADALQRFLADPKVVAGITKLGQSIADLFSDKNLAEGADLLKSVFATAQSAAPFLEQAAKTTLSVVQAGVALFKQLPPGLQALLAGGFAVNKLTGGLVTNVGSGIVGAILGKLKSAVVNVQGSVVNVNGAGLPGVLGGAAGAAEGGAAAGGAAAAGGLGLATIGAGVAAGTAIAALGIMGLGWLITATSSPAQLANAAANATNNQKFLRTFGRQGTAPGKELPSNAFQNAAQQIDKSVSTFAGKVADDLGGLKDTMKGVAAEFSAATKQLAHPKSQTELVHAAQELEKLLLSGRGGAVETAHRIDLLRKQLEKVHDPKTKAALEAKLVKIEGLLPGRQFAARELAKADSILKSHESGNKKIVDLKAVQKALLERGLPHAASVISAKIDAEKRALTYANQQTAAAIKDKDLSLSVSVPVTVNTSVSVRSTIAGNRTFTLAGNVRTGQVGVN